MKRGLVLICMVVTILLIGGSFFYFTGGRGLLRVVRYDLMLDMPDRRYDWGDFFPSGDTQRVSGFYSQSLSNDYSIAIWTLAGIKRFYHQSGTSVYYHRDACGIWRSVIAGDTDNLDVSIVSDIDFDYPTWQRKMSNEYFVTVQWGEQDNKRIVDKLWSISGRYRVLGRVGESTCK